MKPATAGGVLATGIGCLLVLTAGPQAVLYWALVIPSVLLLRLIDIPSDLAIALVAATLFFADVARRKLRHAHAAARARGAIAQEETA